METLLLTDPIVNPDNKVLEKALDKKKNVCWLSVWNTGFKLTFYFTEKTIDGVYEMEVNGKIKKSAKHKHSASWCII
jgi:hypothetical protein